jgi:hypothetical protein
MDLCIFFLKEKPWSGSTVQWTGSTGIDYESTKTSLNGNPWIQDRQLRLKRERVSYPSNLSRRVDDERSRPTRRSVAVVRASSRQRSKGAHRSFTSGCSRARRLGFSSTKWSRGQGDPYPRVLDDRLGSWMAHSGGLKFLVFDGGAWPRLSFSGFKKQL